MKKKTWTVMLIPTDGGERRDLTVSNFHVLGLVGLIAVLSFSTAILFMRDFTARSALKEVTFSYEELERKHDAEAAALKFSPEIRAAIEREVRQEYEARDAALSDALVDLYELETEVRAMTGLKPEAEDTSFEVVPAGGQGGAPIEWATEVADIPYDLARPPNLIAGLENPSSDVLFQEVRLRTRSLRSLLRDVDILMDRLERSPTAWPVDHPDRYISSRYGYRQDPLSKSRKFHSGMDIVAPYKSKVLATGRGVVVYSGKQVYLGNVVKVDHGGGIITMYGHLNKRLVDVGDQVLRGTAIGLLGSTGRSTGPHVHYEVHVDDKNVDPRKYLGK